MGENKRIVELEKRIEELEKRAEKSEKRIDKLIRIVHGGFATCENNFRVIKRKLGESVFSYLDPFEWF